MKRTCVHCNTSSDDLSIFLIDKRAKYDRKNICKSCNRKYMHKKDYYYNKDNQRGWMLKHKYNITIETYKKLHDAQKGLCAICLNPEQSIHRIFLAVDHDHKTGKIRGLLCDKCNRGLGQFKDNIEILEQAIKYLKSGVEENLNVLQ